MNEHDKKIDDRTEALIKKFMSKADRDRDRTNAKEKELALNL